MIRSIRSTAELAAEITAALVRAQYLSADCVADCQCYTQFDPLEGCTVYVCVPCTLLGIKRLELESQQGSPPQPTLWEYHT